MKQQIYSLDLLNNGIPAPFVIRTMEEIAQRQGGIADAPHRHNYYSIIWSHTATGRHIIDFREYPILPRHIFFVSPRQVHQVITDPGPTGLIILFTPEFLQKNSIREDFISNLRLFRDSDDTPPLPLESGMSAKLESYAGNMKAASDSTTDLKYEAIGAWLKIFLIECNNHCSLHPQASTQEMEVGRSLVRRFRQSVEDHFREWHQVKDYANALSVTPNYLNEVIRENIHTPAKDYIQHRLVLEAKRMAVFTDKSSKEIGFELGFEDPSHFSKFFTNFAGIPLARFRTTHPA